MRSSAKPLILFVVVLLAIPALLLLGLNLILQSASVQERIRSGIEKSVGMPVSLNGISATLLGGIKVERIFAGGNDSTPRFTLDSIVLYPSYPKLFQQDVVINELQLNHPVAQLSLADNGTAKLQLLQTAASSQADLTVTNALQKLPIQNPATSSTGIPNISLSPTTEKILRQLPHLTITDGEFTLLNEQKLPLVAVEGMNLTGTQVVDGSWSGVLKARQVTVGSSLIVHELHTPILLSSDASSIMLDDLAATLGGGKLGGKFSILLPPSLPEYKTALTLSEATLNQFFLDASLGSSATEGVITGDLQLSGIAGMPQSMEGKGNLFCTNAVIQPADFLRQIGQVLQIQELQLLRLAEGKALFRVHQGEVQIDSLSLRSENLILTAQGPVRSNGDLDLQARLLFNDKLSGRLHGFLGPQLTQAPEPGYSQVAFHVSGPAKSPKTDLLERLTGIRINGDLGGFLQGLFGRPSNH